MVASTEAELHEFARKVGCTRFSNKRGKFQPHYDVRDEEYDKAVELGAIEVSPKTVVRFLKAHYGKGMDKPMMTKMVMMTDMIRSTFDSTEEGFSEETMARIESLLEKGEEIYNQFEDENPELASHLATLEIVKEIFS